MIDQLTELEEILIADISEKNKKNKARTTTTKKRGVGAIDDTDKGGTLCKIDLVPDEDGEFAVDDEDDYLFEFNKPLKKRAL